MAKHLNAIKADGLYEAIGRVLEDYSSEISRSLDAAADDLSKELLDNIRADSPVHRKTLRRKGRDRPAGAYRKGWHRRREGGRFVISNTHYRLTHLLENGHALRRGGRMIGSVKAYPHILGNADRISKRYEERAKAILSGKGKA